MYVRECGQDLSLFTIWNECVHSMGGGVVYILLGGVICHVGLCFPSDASLTDVAGFTYWGLLIANLENMKQLIVKDLHMTLSSAQNPHYELLHIL